MRVIGNEKTRSRVVFGESRINIGDTINIKQLHKELQDSRRNLLNLRLFTDVEILIDRWTNENKIDLVFFVKERWYVYPIPTLELTGIRFSEWRDDYDYDFDRLTYGLTLLHYNLTGRGDLLELVYKNGFQEEFEVGYSLPGIDRERNWGAGFTVHYANKKGATISSENNDYTSELFNFDVVESKGASVSISHREDITERHTLGFSFTDMSVHDTIINLSPNYFDFNENSQRFSSIFYNVKIEKRNLAEYPTNGYSIQASASYNGLWDNNLNTFFANAQITKYYELNERNYFSGALYGQFMHDKNMPFSNLIAYDLHQRDVPRGYQNYRLFPKNYIGLKTEYRYDLITKEFENIPFLPERFEPVPFRILPKAFIDLGHTFSNQYVTNNSLNNEFLLGFGIGVDVVTIYNTPFTFEISNNRMGELNFNLGIGKSF